MNISLIDSKFNLSSNLMGHFITQWVTNCFAFCGIYGDSYRDNLKRMTSTPSPLEKKKDEKRKKKETKRNDNFSYQCMSFHRKPECNQANSHIWLSGYTGYNKPVSSRHYWVDINLRRHLVKETHQQSDLNIVKGNLSSLFGKVIKDITFLKSKF